MFKKICIVIFIALSVFYISGIIYGIDDTQSNNEVKIECECNCKCQNNENTFYYAGIEEYFNKIEEKAIEDYYSANTPIIGTEEDNYSKLTEEEWECLYRVARSEAGSWSKEGQKNVVYVVLNRVNHNKFPNNIIDVVFQNNQFAVISNGSYYTVEISDFTKENVKEAVIEYYSKNIHDAIFFTTGAFDYEYLFTDEVGHNFYR